jgi:hypothetical protein
MTCRFEAAFPDESRNGEDVWSNDRTATSTSACGRGCTAVEDDDRHQTADDEQAVCRTLVEPPGPDAAGLCGRHMDLNNRLINLGPGRLGHLHKRAVLVRHWTHGPHRDASDRRDLPTRVTVHGGPLSDQGTHSDDFDRCWYFRHGRLSLGQLKLHTEQELCEPRSCRVNWRRRRPAPLQPSRRPIRLKPHHRCLDRFRQRREPKLRVTAHQLLVGHRPPVLTVGVVRVEHDRL